MAREMQLKLVIGADGRAVAPVTAEVRREVAGVGEAGRAAASDLTLLSAANDEAAAAARRAMEAARGQAQAERELRASIDRSIGVKPVLNDNQYKQRQADIAAYGAELDRLRARFVPAAAAEQSLLAVQNDINRAFRLGAIDAREQASALETNRLAHDRVAAAAAAQAEEYRRLAAAGREAWAADQEQVRVNSLLGVGGGSAGSARASADVFEAAGMLDEISTGAALATHEMTNLTYQMNDIVLMLASGQSPFMLMMQQGSQITQIMGQRGLGEIIPAIGSALTKLISPTTMLLAGLTAVGYAGYYAFRRIVPEAKDAESVLTRHAELVEKIEQNYGRAVTAAERFTREAPNILRHQERLARTDLSEMLQAGAKGVFQEVMGGASLMAQYLPKEMIGRSQTLGPIYDAVLKLNEGARRGVPDIDEYRQALLRAAEDPRLSDSIRERAALLLEESELLARLFGQWNDFRPSPRSAQDASMGLLRAMQREAEIERRRAEQAFAADMLGLSARSPAELAAAARAQASAQYNNDETAESRRHRIELAERRALAEAEHALAEAARERGRALAESQSAAQLDLDLVGKSAAEVDRLRMEFQLLSELRREAAQNGVEASQQEIDAIRAVAAETARLRAIAGARELIRTKAEELDMLRVETALVGASSAMRARLLAQLESERDIRERGLEARSREAEDIRAVNAALAAQQIELERLRDGWGAVQQAGESMIDTVFDRLMDGDWQGAIKAIGDDMLKLSMQLGVTNPLKNAAFGTNYGTLGDLGGWGGIAGRLFGGGDSAAESALSSMFGGQAVASMSVTAGTVILAGDAGGGMLGDVTRLLTGANDNRSDRAIERLGDAAHGAAGNLRSFGGGLGEFGRQLANMLSSVPSGGGGGGGFLSTLGSLFGFGGGFTNFEYAWTAAVPGLYDKGGPTGGTDPSRIAGFVHEQEYVFDAESTRRIGVGNLDAIRRGVLGGYREGGYAVTTGAAPYGRSGAGGAAGVTVNVHNSSSAQVEVGQPQQGADGSLSLELMVNELEGRMEASMRAGRLGRAAQQTFGLSRRMAR